MIADMKQAAENVGITALISNTQEQINTQLNKLTGAIDYPIMLISWDLDTDYTFDKHGFLMNPSTKVTCLLMSKADENSKEMHEQVAEEMKVKFAEFIQALYNILAPKMKDAISPITGAGSKLTPLYGTGQHSGVVGRWTQLSEISISC